MESVVRYTAERWLALQKDLGRRLSKRLFDELSRDPDQIQAPARGHVGFGLALAYVAAALVYATSATFGVMGAILLLAPWHSIFTPIVGIILLLLCVVSRPRLGSPPSGILARCDFPALYALSDRIAQTLGTRQIDGITKSAEFGASFCQVGWRKRSYIELGVPLLAVLNLEERVAVIAHELAHGANRDPLRSLILYSAVHTLAVWANAIRPETIGRAGGPFVSLAAIPLELLMLLASEILLLVMKGLLLLVFRQSQRAEYLADRLAASVAGSSETQSALEKLYLTEAVADAIRRHAWTSPKDPIGEHLARAIRAIPPDQLEKLRAESQAALWQVDATHPPTAFRVEMLRTRAIQRPAELLSADERHAFDAEVERLIASTQRDLVNRQLEADEAW